MFVLNGAPLETVRRHVHVVQKRALNPATMKDVRRLVLRTQEIAAKEVLKILQCFRVMPRTIAGRFVLQIHAHYYATTLSSALRFVLTTTVKQRVTLKSTSVLKYAILKTVK